MWRSVCNRVTQFKENQLYHIHFCVYIMRYCLLIGQEIIHTRYIHVKFDFFVKKIGFLFGSIKLWPVSIPHDDKFYVILCEITIVPLNQKK